MITISRASIERISELLDEESDLKNTDTPIYDIKDGSIVFEKCSVLAIQKMRIKLCLNDINLSIKSGETVGILGGTGSSKTTLIQLIPRLYDTTKGTVRVGGLDVKHYDLKTLRDQVAVVLQKNVLFQEPLKKICDGETKMQAMKSWLKHVS